MKTDTKYLNISKAPNSVRNAKRLCEDLNDRGTSENKLLRAALRKIGAKRMVFAVLELGPDAEMAITIHADDVDQVVSNFKGATDKETLEFRDLLNGVLATQIQNDPCPDRKLEP
ncbi:MAG TPA: hypothetical protein VMF11_08275 [Candidatus Baltobacteraceae bacterium]|nr:hypothetical protein [Candidatus Baltobacteraceae bacterium]